MSRALHVDFDWCDSQARRLADRLVRMRGFKDVSTVIGIKRGGCVPAMLIARHLNRGHWIRFASPSDYDKISYLKDAIVVDDICDTGATMIPFKAHGAFACVALAAKAIGKSAVDVKYGQEFGQDTWVAFPWENDDETSEQAAEQGITSLIRHIGDDPNRDGLKETPSRVRRAYEEMTAGSKVDPASLIKTFDAGGYDQMVGVYGVPFHSLCEHHLLPFFGTASVAYIPNGKIIGLSKLARIVDTYARRLQNQERIAEQVATCIMENLKPKGVAVSIEAQHMCMAARGVKKAGATMRTCKLTGVFLKDAKARAEFMQQV